MSVDYWRQVDIPTSGVDARNTDALECLLALCRVMGLNYKITESDGKYSASVAWSNWPTDFFVPYKTEGSYSVVGAKDPAGALRDAIDGAVRELNRNAEAFRHWYNQYAPDSVKTEKQSS